MLEVAVDGLGKCPAASFGRAKVAPLDHLGLDRLRPALGLPLRGKACDITPALIAQYRDQLAAETYRRARPGAKRSSLTAGEQAREFKRKPNTINNYLVSLGRIFSVARREWHWITHNPMEGVAKLRAGPGRVRYLSEDERQRLLAETV